jgi:hypothetical protein
MRYIGTGLDGGLCALVCHVLIIENVYFLQFFIVTSHGVAHVIPHPTEETTLDLGFARRSYAHPT